MAWAFTFGVLTLAASQSFADLRSAPTWWDPDGVGVGQDWHYRVPISIASGTPINATIRVDVDFAALLTQLGISGTFDANSPRIIRSTGVLSTTQEFNGVIYQGATNATATRGEMRFILEDAGPQTYYLYFDVTQNGAKSTNTQSVINGNFEQGTSATGVQSPSNWIGAVTTAGYLAQVRPSETVSVTLDTGGAVVNTDGTPNTGNNSYLLGWRSNVVDPGTANAAGATLSRTIAVPVSNPGNLVFRYRPEGWDSVYAATSYDYLIVDVLNSGGTVLATLVGPTTTANATTAAAYRLYPASPNYGTNGNAISATTPGYGNYDYIDCDTTATHRNAMTGTCGASPWYTVTQSLTAWAGTTVTLRFRAFSVASYQSWYSIDDVEWSVTAGTLGAAQAWGINIAAPAAGTAYFPGQTIPLTVQVDARPTAATNPLTVNLYDNTGTARVTGVALTGSGATYSNATGLVMPLSATTSTGWTIRAFGLDSSTSTVAATNGLAHINGQLNTPLSQTGYWNIDEILVNVSTANVSIVKTSTVLTDPINGSSNPRAIPGATVQYCILITNNGPQTASSVTQTDVLPSTVSYVAGSLRAGTTCANATATPPTGTTISYAATPSPTISATIGTMANAASYAIVFNATIN